MILWGFAAFVIPTLSIVASVAGWSLPSFLFLSCYGIYVYRRFAYWKTVEDSLPSNNREFVPDRTGGVGRMLLSVVFADIWGLFSREKVPHTDVADFLGGMVERRDEAIARGGSYFRLWKFHPMVIISRASIFLIDPELIASLLSRKNWTKFEKGLHYQVSRPMIGSGALLSSPDGDSWRHQRKKASAGFRTNVLIQASVNTLECCKRLAKKWEKNAGPNGETEVNLISDTKNVMLDVIAMTAFSYDLKSSSTETSEESALCRAYDTIVETISERARGKALTSWIPTKENRAFDECCRMLDSKVDEIISERRKNLGGKPADAATDLLDQLLAKDDDGAAMPVDLVRDNIKTFLFAGHETTANALAWSIYLLSTHRQVECDLLAELASVDSQSAPCSKCGEGLYRKLEAAPLLNAVIKETLRLYPPGALTRKPASKHGAELAGIHVPYDVEVLVVPMLVHRDGRYWDNPDDFVPARWLDRDRLVNDKGQTPEQRGIYLPFSLGMRNCVGRLMAMAELRMSIKFFIQNFKFTPKVGTKDDIPRPIFLLTVSPNRMLMGVEKR